VWTKIECHLSSTNIETGRVITNWSSLLSKKCEDSDLFLDFYRKTKGILNKLTRVNSIAAKDKVFLKAYFSMAIEAKELQTEVKGFLCDMSATYSETLELIHADFRAQTTYEHLCDTTTRSGSILIVRRGITDDDVNPNKTDTPSRSIVPFPSNHDKLISSEYYHQLREWYAVLSMFKNERTPESSAWIHIFKFNFDLAPPGGWQRYH